MEMTCNVQFTVNGGREIVLRWVVSSYLFVCGSSKCLSSCTCCTVTFLSSIFFFDSAAQVLKVEQGEKYPPFVLDSVFQISDDEGRG